MTRDDFGDTSRNFATNDIVIGQFSMPLSYDDLLTSILRCIIVRVSTHQVLPVHVLNTDANSPLVSFEFLHAGQLHDGLAHISQTLGGQVRTSDVLDEGSQVDTRVLLGITVRCCE